MLTDEAFWLVAMGIAAAFVVLLWLIYWVYRAKALEREERRLMIERGIAPPAPAPVGWPAVKVREQELQYEERRLLIEKGLTPEVIESGLKLGSADGTSFVDAFLPKRNPRQPEDYLRKGLRALAFGLSLAVAYVVFRTSGVDASDETRNWFLFFAVISAPIAFFGAANLVYYRMTRDRARVAGITAPGPGR